MKLHPWFLSRIATVIVGVTLWTADAAARPVASDTAALPPVEAHDNRDPAGSLLGTTLVVDLRAAAGVLRPQGAHGPALRVEAFGEGSGALVAPAPLIRVPEGTEVVARIRNDLTHGLRVHGLCDRTADCAPLEVPAGETRSISFKSGPAGTYHYWATTTAVPARFRATADAQLSGAFIVDPPGSTSNDDRLFVITEWTSVTRAALARIAAEDDPGAAFLSLRPDILFLINGRAWPATERLTYVRGERVSWRIINLSTQWHPMHLHGFYFDVTSIGDGVREKTFAASERPHVVTQLMAPTSTMTMTWTPGREGNWLFHCHVMTHVSPVLNVDGSIKPGAEHHRHDDHAAGMTGMVLGVTVKAPPDAVGEVVAPARPARRLTLKMAVAASGSDERSYGFVVDPGVTPETQRVSSPGPLLVLRRDEPVEITLVNALPEATSIHWHGMELDSYYDGVHGWSGVGASVTPMVGPGESFVVRFTPPRAGTFIYHTHLHDRRQLTAGLYGGMIVVGPDETFDATTDHVFVLGRHGAGIDAPTVVNGQRAAREVWKAGVRHRVRVINITPDDVLAVSLAAGDGPAVWQPVGKDGAALPEPRRQSAAARQLVGVGETYDFEYQAPPGRRTLWFEVRTAAGKWEAQGHVIVR